MCTDVSQKELDTRVGLEVHARLKTGRKLFCSCPVDKFAPPDSQICEYCTAQPGALPVTDENAVRLALAAAMMFGARVSEVIAFDRKSYFYPDLPKGYQITQHFTPLATGGTLELRNGKKVRLRQLHIEEDAARLEHSPEKTLVDHNRCGIPLLEVVTEPDLTDGTEVGQFLALLRRSLRFSGIAECDMHSGGFRVDLNVSVKCGERVEIKNVGSFRAARNCVDVEVQRQCEVLKGGGNVRTETRHCLDESGHSTPSRDKEALAQYRYMPEPDLRPVRLSSEMLEDARSLTCELPLERERRFVAEYGLSEEVAQTLCSELHTANLLDEAVAEGGPARECGNWIASACLAESEPGKVSAQDLAALCSSIDRSKLNRRAAREQVWPEMADGTKSFAEALAASDLEQHDADDLRRICEKAAQAMPEAVQAVRTGKQKAIGALIGEVMRETKGAANANEVREILVCIIRGDTNG